jgi:hypothetical protein
MSSSSSSALLGSLDQSSVGTYREPQTCSLVLMGREVVQLPGDSPILQAGYFKGYFRFYQYGLEDRQKSPLTYAEVGAEDAAFSLETLKEVFKAKNFRHITQKNVREFLSIYSYLGYSAGMAACDEAFAKELTDQPDLTALIDLAAAVQGKEMPKTTRAYLFYQHRKSADLGAELAEAADKEFFDADPGLQKWLDRLSLIGKKIYHLNLGACHTDDPLALGKHTALMERIEPITSKGLRGVRSYWVGDPIFILLITRLPDLESINLDGALVTDAILPHLAKLKYLQLVVGYIPGSIPAYLAHVRFEKVLPEESESSESFCSIV